MKLELLHLPLEFQHVTILEILKIIYCFDLEIFCLTSLKELQIAVCLELRLAPWIHEGLLGSLIMPYTIHFRFMINLSSYFQWLNVFLYYFVVNVRTVIFYLQFCLPWISWWCFLLKCSEYKLCCVHISNITLPHYEFGKIVGLI